MRSLIGFCVVHLKHGAIIGDDVALIGELAAGLRVERRTVQDHLDGGGADTAGTEPTPSCMMPMTRLRDVMSV